MLFHSSLRRELGRTFSATLFVLVIIVVTMMLIKTLNLANQGTVNPSQVSLVLGYTMLAYFPTILTLSLFISIVSTLSRMYRDSEMAVWFSSGQGLMAFVRPLFWFSLPVVLAIAVLSLVGWPWANAQTQELRSRYQTRGDVERVAPGQFQESSDGRRVFYIDSDARQEDAATTVTEGSKLFVFSREPHSEVVVAARSGEIKTIDDARFAVLADGQSTEMHDDQSLTLSRFREYGIRLDAKIAPSALSGDLSDPQVLAATPSRVIPTRSLLRYADPRLQGELGWRLGMALAGINFVLLALASSRINPRSGRSGGVILALLFFVLYYNLINFGQNWVAQQKISLGGLLLLLHGGIFAACLTWLWLRQNMWTWHRLLPARRPAQSAGDPP